MLVNLGLEAFSKKEVLLQEQFEMTMCEYCILYSEANAEKAEEYAEEKLNLTFHKKQRAAILAFLTGSD